MVFEDPDGQGAYATMFEEIYMDEELTAAYRVLVLDDEVLRDISNTLEQKAASHQKLHAKADEYAASVTSEDAFIELAKKYSVDTSTILSGGYTSGVKAADFQTSVMDENGEAKVADEDQILIDWLYDPARQKGDMIVIDCVDSVKLYYYCDCMPAYMSQIRNEQISETYNAWYTGVISDSSYSTIVNHGLIDFFT